MTEIEREMYSQSLSDLTGLPMTLFLTFSDRELTGTIRRIVLGTPTPRK